MAVIAGAGAFVLFLLTGLPASVVTGLAGNEALRFRGVSGTAWTGEVAALSIGDYPVRNLGWSLHPLALLLGRLSADIRADIPGGSLRGRLEAGLGGLALSNFEAGGNLRPVARAIGLQQAGGRGRVAIEVLGINGGWPRKAVGSLRVTGFPLLPDGGAPGDFQLDVTAPEIGEDGRFSADIKDLGGPLEVSGTLTLSPPGDYELNSLVRPRPDAPSALVDGLSLLGAADASGRRQVSLAGSI